MIKKERTLFLIDTPLQLLNAINFVLINEISDSCDAYIVKQFRGADEYIKRVRSENIFKNVYFLEKEKKGVLKHIYTIIGLIFPKVYCRILLNMNFKDFFYKKIFLSAPTKMFDFIISASKAEIINGIEDGVGSYTGDIFHDYLSVFYLKIRKLTRHDYEVKKLYLRSPDYYIGQNKNIFSLQNAMKKQENRDKIYRIFLYEENFACTSKAVIYLNQPLGDFDKSHLGAEKKIVDLLQQNMQGEYRIRLHPRETQIDFYRGHTIDGENKMWELFCENNIGINNVLIGMFSTAQFVPKLFYDKEPTIIFTYPLYGDLTKANFDKYEKMATYLKSTYTEKNKVYIVDSEKSFEKLLQMVNIN